MRLRHRKVLIPLILLIAAVNTAQAVRADEPVLPPQEKAPPALELQPTMAASMATIEKIIEAAVHNIATRYTLNEAQTRETDALMKREVHKFLKEHEAEVWPVIRDVLASKLGANPPSDAAELKRIGDAARPLTKLAKEAIFQANAEWRTYLTAEQQRMHDFDMAEMEKTFQDIDRNFADWAEGKPTGKGVFPTRDSVRGGPPIPPKPAQDGLPFGDFSIGFFETFVEQFIKDYLLDEGQIDSARSILKEFKDKANDFKKNNKADLVRLAAATKGAMQQRDMKRRAEVDAERKKLLEPVYELFAQMETRLRGLLDTQQLERYHANNRGLAPKSPEEASAQRTAENGVPSEVVRTAASSQASPVSPADSTNTGAKADPESSGAEKVGQAQEREKEKPEATKSPHPDGDSLNSQKNDKH